MNSEHYFRGYDRGNYGAAYESEDWESWREENAPPEGLTSEQRADYEAGMLLGFFSSFEVYEIGDPDVADQVEHLRTQYGE